MGSRGLVGASRLTRPVPPVRSLEGVVADSAGSGPLVGASVLLMTPGDTLLRITDSRGAFRFESVRDSSVRLRIGYLGYRGTTRNVSTTAGTNRIDTVFLGEIPISLGEIVVQGRRPLMSERGDTIVYHAENVHVLPGDEALQIVRGLPGMELKEGEVRFMGKTIERTYVDGRPLFGENARSALDFLAANDVVDIQVYDELPEEERLKGNKNGKKRTVMNLVTRSKPEKSVNVEALAGYGADIDRGPDGHRKGRYGAGASYNYFSERRIYSVEANSNNNNQSSNRIRDRFASYAGGGDGDRRSTTLGASLTHRYGKHLTLSGNYRFANERSETQRITQQIYFPSEAYLSRSYTDTTRASRLGRQHSANLDLRYNPKNDYLVFATSVQYSDDLSHSYRGARNELDGETTNRVGATERNREKSRNLSGRLIWAHSFKNNPKRMIHINAQGSTSRDDASGWRIDSLSTDNDRTFLETTAGGWSRSLGGNFSYTEPLGEKSSVTAGYGISVDNSHSKRMAVNRFTGLIDTTSTYDYTRNYTTQTAELGFNRYSQTCYLFVRMGYQSARQNRDEAFPETHDDRRTFRSLQPSLSFHYSIGQTRNLYFNYSGSVRQPSVEQLRAELDTRNRLSLTGGTPGLRQSYTHSVSLGYYHTDTKSSRSVGFNLSADLTVRDIATRQRFFAEDTPLEQYGGYVAPKGSTLTTPGQRERLGIGSGQRELLDSAQAAEVGSELHGRHRIQPPALVYRRRARLHELAVAPDRSASDRQPIDRLPVLAQREPFVQPLLQLAPRRQQHDHAADRSPSARQLPQARLFRNELRLLPLPQLLVCRRRRRHAYVEPLARSQAVQEPLGRHQPDGIRHSEP